ncbi:MAG: hypothetical protein M1370_12295 [Bacteroidetes bacterium]|nr:hypothetical protein [Bacteroidota bacterium]
MRIERLSTNPIIVPDMDARMGSNINGPSLIRAPAWLPNPLGRYYLYFAHHRGLYIRLAYADHLEGPWRTYEPGVLDLKDSFCTHHVASPDVHVDDERREVRMYYHGRIAAETQRSKVALSMDGINFTCFPQDLGNPYFRVFRWGGYHYALGMPGVFYRSADGLTKFEQGPTLFGANMRHSALKLDGNRLSVFYTNAYDCPEGILHATIDLTGDWMSWRETAPSKVAEPETDYEGADLPLEPSARGPIMQRVRQLRDPAIFQEGEQTYLLYSVAGEYGIAIARLTEG